MTAKQAMIELANDLADDVDWDEAHYQLFLRERIQHSMEQVKRGETVSQEYVEEQFEQWLKQSGG
jgi:hypothetical protein